MHIFSIIVLVLLALVLLVLGGYLLVGSIAFRLVLSKNARAKKLSSKHMAQNLDEYMIDLEWWKNYPFEVLSVTSFDNFKLCGHYLNNNSDKLAILVHGYGGDFRETFNYAKYFYIRGYDLLAIESRAHGASEGDMITMGYLEHKDICSWIELSITKNPNYKIALFGLSMGASAVCMSLGDNLPENVKCAISDCGFDNAFRQLCYIYSHRLHISAKPFMNFFNGYLKRVKGLDLKQADVVKALKKSQLPVLFIHGKEDKFVPTEMVYRLSEVLPEGRKEVYIVEGAKHAMSYPTSPKEYEHRLNRFLDKYYM